MTDKLHESGLYEAATNSLASDASSDNTWSKMVTASMVYTDVNVFKHELRKVERLIKSEYKLKSMPTAWRSAKSVVLGALDKGIKLTDENGLILGKSAMQLLLKTSREPSDPFHRVTGALAILRKCLPECDAAQKTSARVVLRTLLED